MQRTPAGPQRENHVFLLIMYFFAQSFFSPAIFIVFFVLGPSLGEALGVEAIQSVGVNLSRINLGFFLTLALIFNAAFYMANFALVGSFVPGLSFLRFCSARFTYWSVVPLAFGLVHLKVWSDAMEGNVFGFIFVLPLLALALYQFVFFCVQNSRLMRQGALR